MADDLAREELAGVIAGAARQGLTFRGQADAVLAWQAAQGRKHPCCKHCVDDPIFHAENPPHSHEVRCDQCGDYAEGYNAALAQEASEAEVEAAARVLLADYTSEYDNAFTWREFEDQARRALAAAREVRHG